MIRVVLLPLPLLAACGDVPKPDPSPSVVDVAAQSVDAYSDYLHKSKTAEAKLFLRQIARSAGEAMTEERFGADGQLAAAGPPAAAPMTPAAGSCCKQPKGRCVPTPADWQHPSWQSLHFEIADPHYFSYELEPTADGFIARAIGDLDCDGTFSKHEQRGTLKNGELVLDEMTSVDPME